MSSTVHLNHVSYVLGTEAPGQALKEEKAQRSEGGGATVVYNPHVSLSIEQQRQRLPVFKVKESSHQFALSRSSLRFVAFITFKSHRL